MGVGRGWDLIRFLILGSWVLGDPILPPDDEAASNEDPQDPNALIPN